MRFQPCVVPAMILMVLGVPMSAHANDAPAVEVASGFIRQLETGDYSKARERMSPEVRSALSLDTLKQIWESLPTQFGAYRTRGTAVASRAEALTMITVPLTFENGELDAAIAVDASGQIVGLHFRPPSASTKRLQAAPSEGQSSGVAREVIIGKGKGVPGTLLMPHRPRKQPVPALLLVPGSGPQDRNGTVGENHPYADIASGLASLGVATLRFDKRTLVRPEEFKSANITLDDEVGNDASAALALLASTPGIDRKRIFLFGHSLGGVAAVSASQQPSVAGLVLFAVPSRPVLDLVLDQVEYIAKLDGNVDPDEAERLQQLRAQVERVRAGDMDESILGAPAPYWTDLERRNVVTGVLGLRKPVLMLQGGRDYQVTTADWKVWQEQAVGHLEISLREYPSLNHLGIPGSTRSTPEEYLTPGQVDQGLIREVAEWVLHTKQT